MLLSGNHTVAAFAWRQGAFGIYCWIYFRVAFGSKIRMFCTDGSMAELNMNKKPYCVNAERRSCHFPADCTCGAALPSRMLISNSVRCQFETNVCDGKPCGASAPTGGCAP